MTVKKPKRLPLRRTHGAPPYVLAVHRYDAAPNTSFSPLWHYTVCFTWPIWEPKFGWRLPFLCVAQDPADYSEWGELSDRRDRRGCGQLVSWSDVPEVVQNHVINRCNYPDPLICVTLSKEPGCTGLAGYLLAADHGHGYYGPPEGFRSKAAAQTYCKEQGWCLVDEHDPWLAVANERFRKQHKLG